eukprot:m.16360 g.16360  ORF g.16360 m.16360 type:complete len:122 (+) comp7066_c0_seq1:191-556(+)
MVLLYLLLTLSRPCHLSCHIEAVLRALCIEHRHALELARRVIERHADRCSKEKRQVERKWFINDAKLQSVFARCAEQQDWDEDLAERMAAFPSRWMHVQHICANDMPIDGAMDQSLGTEQE